MVMFVLGAGASRDAGVPDSQGMLGRISSLVEENVEWKNYQPLYDTLVDTIEATIRESQGVDGDQAASNRPLEGRQRVLNIETLVDEIRLGLERTPKSRRHRGFLRMVLREVGNLLELEDPRSAAYLGELGPLSDLAGRPILVVTLNFDRCLEANAGIDFHVATGIEGFGKRHPWSIRNFALLFLQATVLLYKMHGSSDWRFTPDGRLYSIRSTRGADHENAAMVIGFRDKEARLFWYPYGTYKKIVADDARTTTQIVVLGYSFADRGINDMIHAAVRNRRVKNLIVVGPGDPDELAALRRDIGRQFGFPEKIVMVPATAREFLTGLVDRVQLGDDGTLEIRLDDLGCHM